MINFRKGDPHTKVDQGYARLPGEGYEALHPELAGLDPEDYPDIAKMRILGDVAPYSREYQRFAGIVRHQSSDDPGLRSEYEQIADQVRRTKESTLQVSRRHFNAPVDEVEGTVRSASAAGVELDEYPGRVFHFSPVGSSMADLTRSLHRGAQKTHFAHGGEGAGTPPLMCAQLPGRPRTTPGSCRQARVFREERFTRSRCVPCRL